MILLHSVLLVLFLPSLLQGEDVFSAKSIIKWSMCDTSKCYCLKSGNSLTEHSQALKPAADPVDSTEVVVCDIGMQSRYFNDKSAIVEMQVVGKNVAAGDSVQLTYFQGTTKLFGCTFKDGKVTLDKELVENDNLKVDAKSFRKFRIDLFEDQSHITPSGDVYCAIKIGRAEKLKKYLEETNPGMGLQDPFMTLTTKSSVDAYTFGGAYAQFFVKKLKRRCDPYSFKDPERSDEYHVLPVKNRHREISCDGYKSYTMRYDDDNTVKNVAARVECVAVNNGYVLQLITGTPDAETSTPLTEPEKYTFYCTKPFDEICTKPASTCTTDCPEYTEGSPGKAATLTCKDKKWVMDGAYVVLDNEPVCGPDPLHPSGADFHIGDDNSKPGEACFTDYDCKKKSILDYPTCIDDAECEVKIEGGVMKCNDTKLYMRINDYEANTEVNITNAAFTCEGASGVWKNATGFTLPESARVRCLTEDVEIATQYTAASMSDITVYGIIGAVSLGFIVGIIIIYFLILRWTRRRHDIRAMTKEDFGRMPKDLQISFVQRDYATIKKKPTTGNMISGLNLIDVLADTETVHSECWVEAYMFLRLFLGTIERYDMGIMHLTYRFLFLKARAIIKKHGWALNTQRIIKKKKEKETARLIRVVAIRLLAFCLKDTATEVEVTKMVEEGFRKLGWDMAEQYPHCGLLWSLVQPAHPRKHKKREAPNEISGLKFVDFSTYLKAIAKEATGEQKPTDGAIIAEFGTPAQQAAYALGRLTSLSYHRNFAKSMIFLWNDAAKTMAKIRAVISEKPLAELSRHMLRVIVAIGNHPEAKRMETVFLPPPAESNLEAMQWEQRDFEEGLEKADKEELRSWLAARTDLPDLKRKPVYCKQKAGGAKLDDSVGPAKVDSGCPGSDNPAASPAGSGSSSSRPEAAAPATPRSPN